MMKVGAQHAHGIGSVEGDFVDDVVEMYQKPEASGNCLVTYVVLDPPIVPILSPTRSRAQTTHADRYNRTKEFPTSNTTSRINSR